MKKFIALISLLSISLVGNTQQLEHYTQYQHNQFAFNPALAGTKNCLDVRTGYRFQWAGIDGAPQTGFINVHAPLRLSKQNRTTFGPKHGIGGQIKRDVFGPFSLLSLHAAYAIHMPVTRKWTTSLGLAIGFKQSVYDAASITTEISDPAFPGTSQSFLIPDAKIGVWVTNKKTYFGLSMHNLLGNTLSKIGPGAKAQRHIYFTAGHSFSLEKNWSFVPSLFVLWTKSTPIDFHLSALLDLNNIFSFGLGMRRTDAITAQVRVKFFKWISIGYSFDFIISKLSGNMWHSHEITGGFNSCSNYGDSRTTSCPSFE